MSRKQRFFKTAAFLAVVAAVATALDVLVFFPHRPASGKGAAHRVEIPRGAGPNGLADILSEADLIESPGRLVLWLRLTGRMKTVKAGTFDIPDNLSPAEVIDALSGRSLDKGTKVTVPEGFTLSRIARTMEDAGLFSASDFIEAATDKARVKKYGFSSDTFEGLLFPDTYFFSPSASPDDVIRTMTDNFRRRLKQAGIPENDSLLRTVTLASIVQAEARVESEMPTVAGVYRNRLTRSEHPSRLLQADPSVSYGCEPFIRPRADSCRSFEGVLTRKQLDDDGNPYNTYKHPGLPPGPICAPGARALAAAHRPPSVPYFYFVTNASDDGTHIFSTTYSDHQKAVNALRAAERKASPKSTD